MYLDENSPEFKKRDNVNIAIKSCTHLIASGIDSMWALGTLETCDKEFKKLFEDVEGFFRKYFWRKTQQPKYTFVTSAINAFNKQLSEFSKNFKVCSSSAEVPRSGKLFDDLNSNVTTIVREILVIKVNTLINENKKVDDEALAKANKDVEQVQQVQDKADEAATKASAEENKAKAEKKNKALLDKLEFATIEARMNAGDAKVKVVSATNRQKRLKDRLNKN